MVTTNQQVTFIFNSANQPTLQANTVYDVGIAYLGVSGSTTNKVNYKISVSPNDLYYSWGGFTAVPSTFASNENYNELMTLTITYTTAQAGTTTGTFGNTSNSATDYSSVGTVTLSPYTMNNVNGQLSSVTMPLWMSSTSASITCVIYNTQNQLIAASLPQTVVTTNQQVTFIFNSANQPTLQANTVYDVGIAYLGVSGSTTNKVNYKISVSPNDLYYSWGGFTAVPSTFASNENYNELMTLTITYTTTSQSATISQAATTAQSGFYPPLHVSGKYIEDSQNNVVLLKGWDKNGFEDYPQGSWQYATGGYSYGSFNNATVAANLEAMKADGANFIRVVSDSMYALNSVDLNWIAQLAQLCAAQGMYMCYVLIANNNIEPEPVQCPFADPGNGYINTVADFVNMWGNISLTLKNYPNVLFELWGEPSTTESVWWGAVQQTINDIRNTGCTNCIIVQWQSGVYYGDFPGASNSDMSWVGDGVNYSGTDYTPANLNDPTGNLIYSTHIYLNGNFMYADYSTDYSTADFLTAMQNTGVFAVAAVHPMLIGEIGEDLTDSNTVAQLNWYTYAVNLFLSNGIGVCEWWWHPSGSGTPYDTLTGGANFALNNVGQATSNIFSSAS